MSRPRPTGALGGTSVPRSALVTMAATRRTILRGDSGQQVSNRIIGHGAKLGPPPGPGKTRMVDPPSHALHAMLHCVSMTVIY